MPAEPPATARHHPRAFTQVAWRLSEHAAPPPATAPLVLQHPFPSCAPGTNARGGEPAEGPTTHPSLRSGSLQGRAGPRRGATHQAPPGPLPPPHGDAHLPACTPSSCSPTRCSEVQSSLSLLSTTLSLPHPAHSVPAPSPHKAVLPGLPVAAQLPHWEHFPALCVKIC